MTYLTLKFPTGQSLTPSQGPAPQCLAPQNLETAVSNKISGMDSRPTPAAERGSVERTRRNDKQAEGGATPAPTVEITDSARRLAALESVLAKFPEVDSKRVDAIRQALANGTYRSDPAAIADKLMASEAIFDVTEGSGT